MKKLILLMTGLVAVGHTSQSTASVHVHPHLIVNTEGLNLVGFCAVAATMFVWDKYINSWERVSAKLTRKLDAAELKLQQVQENMLHGRIYDAENFMAIKSIIRELHNIHGTLDYRRYDQNAPDSLQAAILKERYYKIINALKTCQYQIIARNS